MRLFSLSCGCVGGSMGLHLFEEHEHGGHGGIEVKAADPHALVEGVVVHLSGRQEELLVVHLKGDSTSYFRWEYVRGERAEEVRSVGFTRCLTKVKSPLISPGTSVDKDLQGY